ncbi:hypothetical protein ACFL6S_10730 [Candidatus Poribacteria bacterium]
MKPIYVRLREFWPGYLVLFGLVVLFGAVPKVAQSQMMLYIDFETEGTSNTFPDQGFNDAAMWNAGAQTPNLVRWVNVKHAGSGRLLQTLNSNANTTTTKAPAPADCQSWTDYIVQMTITYDDDDKWPLVFRYTDENNYYFFAVEQALSDQGGSPIAYLRKAPAADGEFNGIGIGASPTMPGVEIKRGAMQEGTLNTPVETQEWVVRVELEGDSIKCYFFSRGDIRELDDPAPNAPIIEAADASNPEGCVGIRNDSIVGTIDDFAVYGEDGLGALAVDAIQKLAVTWGSIKKQ